MRLSKDALANIWFPFTYHGDLEENPPIVVDRGSGVYLYDKSGRGYIDAIGSWWVSILGHNHPEITAAVKEQLDKVEHVLMAGCISEPTVETARLLVHMMPRGLTRVFFSDNGSTAVEVALKIALQYWALRGEQRTEFVGLSGSYHGDTLGAMAVGMIPQYHTLFHERFKGFSFSLSPYCYRCPLGLDKQTCEAQCVESLETLLSEHGDRVAGCIFEPMVQGAAGMRVYPAKVLKRIFAACRTHSVLTVADEVAMGLGRTGTLFACEHSGESPDIMCVAKGLTGGYMPMSATVVREEIYAEFCGAFPSDRIFHHGHSYTGNPLASAAAQATLRILLRDRIPQSLGRLAQHFRRELEKFRELECVGDVRSIGMVGAIELVANRGSKEPFPARQRVAFRIARRALDLGLIIRPLGDVLYFMPAYVITEDAIDNMFHLARLAIGQTLDELHTSA
jgi:adenosylmethionine-8-amino-7-oxononanoate aminotransferase